MHTDIGELWLCTNTYGHVSNISFGKREGFFYRFRYLPANGHCDSIKKQLKEYFNKQRTHFDVECVFNATRFQKQVWQALLTIPYGKLISYAELAEIIGNPYSYRAVGNAAGANPIAIIVPCHRVIRGSGAIGGYAGGVEKKRFLLHLEGSLT